MLSAAVCKSAGLLATLTRLQGTLAKLADLAVLKQGRCCMLPFLSESMLS